MAIDLVRRQLDEVIHGAVDRIGRRLGVGADADQVSYLAQGAPVIGAGIHGACRGRIQHDGESLALGMQRVAQRAHQRGELGAESGVGALIVQLDAVKARLAAQRRHVLLHEGRVNDQVVQPIGAPHAVDQVADLEEHVRIGDLAGGLWQVGDRSIAGQGGALEGNHCCAGRHIGRLLGRRHKADPGRLGLRLGDQVEGIQVFQIGHQIEPIVSDLGGHPFPGGSIPRIEIGQV